MTSWNERALGDVLTLQRGFDITKSTQQPGPHPVVSSSGINSYHNEYKVQGPGVVIGRKGTLGTAFFIEEYFWPHDTTLWVRDFKGNEPKYCYYLLKSMGLERFDVGASNPTLNRNHLHLLPVTVPDPATQRRIASILSAYDDLIGNNTRRIAILEEMARRIYDEWFVHFRFPGHEGVKMVETELGLVPEGWSRACLDDVVHNVRNPTQAGDHLSDRRYVPIDCITSRSLALGDAKSWTEAQSSLVLFEERDILFGAMRPYLYKVALAPFAGVTRTTCFVLRPKQETWAAFATMTSFQKSAIEFANAHAQGTTIPYAVWDGSLAAYPIVFPPEDILARYERVVGPMLEFIRTGFFLQQNLRAQRDLLLPKLISGEIDVSELPDAAAQEAAE